MLVKKTTLYILVWPRYQTRASHWAFGPLTAYVIIPLFLKVTFLMTTFITDGNIKPLIVINEVFVWFFILPIIDIIVVSAITIIMINWTYSHERRTSTLTWRLQRTCLRRNGERWWSFSRCWNWSDNELANPPNGNCHLVIGLISQEGGLTTTIVRAPVLKDDPEYKWALYSLTSTSSSSL